MLYNNMYIIYIYYPYNIYIYIHTLYIINYTRSTARGGGGSFKNRKPIGDVVGGCDTWMAERTH